MKEVDTDRITDERRTLVTFRQAAMSESAAALSTIFHCISEVGAKKGYIITEQHRKRGKRKRVEEKKRSTIYRSMVPMEKREIANPSACIDLSFFLA